jgi:outer membrane protein, heavy metal efflux system
VKDSASLRRKRDFLIVTAAVMLWGSCSVSAQTSNPTPQPSAASPSPLTLNAATQEALANNLSFRAELERIGVAEGQLRQAELVPNPVASATIVTDRFAANEGEGSRSAGIDQEFETAGKRRYRILTARSDLDRARHETEVAERDLIAQTQQTYFTLLLNERDLDLAQRTSGVIERFVTLNRKRVQVGEVPGLDLNLAEVELARARKYEQDFERRHRETSAHLNLLLGRPQNSPAVKLASEFSTSESSLPDDRAFVEYAVLHRSDLLAAESNLEARANAARLARAFRIPNVTLGLSYQRQRSVFGVDSGPLTAPLSSLDHLVAFTATVPLPLFNRNQGNIASAEHEKRAAAEGALYVRNVVGSQVAEALSNYRSRVSTRELFERSILPQLEKNLDAITESYRLGNESIFAVIQVQRTYFETRHEYLQTLIDLELDRIALEKAAGLPFDQAIRVPAAGEKSEANQ